MSDTSIEPGMVVDATQEVTPQLTAPHIGSGSLHVFATPAMIMLIEKTCAEMVAPFLPDNQTTVGVEVHVRHIAPTPVGGIVRIRAEIVSTRDNLITFKAQVWDEVELIGVADHHRVVVDTERFLRRVRVKAAGGDNRAPDFDE